MDYQILFYYHDLYYQYFIFLILIFWKFFDYYLQINVNEMKLKEISKEYLSKNVFRPLHFNSKTSQKKYNILVVDEFSMKVVSSCFNMNQIFEEGITVVENISKKREPFPTIDAIYLLLPTWETIRNLISDFTNLKNSKVLYKSAHIFFLHNCSNDLFEELSKSNATKYIKTLKEINLSFIAHENQIFHVLKKPLNNKNCQNDEIHQLADGISSFCATLGVYPILRFHSDFAHSAEICYRIEQKLDELMKFDKSLGVECDAELIIIDRSFDLCTPLLHDLHFQAMAADLVKFENGIYEYRNENGATRKALFDENDEMWVELRHEHIAHVMNRLALKTKETTQPSTSSSLREINSTIQKLPAHMRKVNQLGAYINLAEECLRIFKEDFLNEICVLEQDISTGYSEGGVPIREMHIARRLGGLINFKLSPENRLRIMLIYVTSMPEKSEVFYEKMMEVMDLEDVEHDFIFRKMYALMKKTVHRVPRKKWKEYEEKFLTARWVPRIGDVLNDAVSRNLDQSKFLIIGRKPVNNLRNVATSVRFGKNKENNDCEQNRKIILFVNGGITYSEMRLAYQISKQTKNTTIFLGSDKILTPQKYIEQFKEEL